MSEPMTRRDREQLAQVAKMRARVAKSSVETRESALRAQVEQELDELFKAEEAAVAKAIEIAQEIGRRAQQELTERLDELGVRREHRPALGLQEPRVHAVASRRQALRQLGRSRIEALGRAAKVSIDSACADTVTSLIAGGLDSEAAQQFLDSMPSVEELMMAPSVAELEAVHDEQRRERRQLMGGDW